MITTCRSCYSSELEIVLDLGSHRLSDFADVMPENPPTFPLRVLRCNVCTLAQLSTTVPAQMLYHPRYSFKSNVSEAIIEDLAGVVREGLAWPTLKITRWLDIACNDGTLLRFVPGHIWREGVDPLIQFAPEATKHADRITTDFFHPKHFDQMFDVITSISMFYDIDDPNTFVEGVKSVLAKRGIWIIQQNYLPTMLRQNSIDNVSHEHLAYYSLRSLEHLLYQHGLEVNRVWLNPINGGCFRTIVSRIGMHPVEQTVHMLRQVEYDHQTAWSAFRLETTRSLNGLRQFVKDLVSKRQLIYVYGASTRGGTIWQAAELDARDMPLAVDRNPVKVGKVMTSIGAPIISEERAREIGPNYFLVGPWWLREHIVKREQQYLKDGGKLIFPLPSLEVVSR